MTLDHESNPVLSITLVRELPPFPPPFFFLVQSEAVTMTRRFVEPWKRSLVPWRCRLGDKWLHREENGLFN